jgi:DNA ligase D-like protein (predicted 3'-phosphoesterase)
MPLKQYSQKRDLKKSGEPKAKVVKKKGKKPIFCIQKHKASHLHWDLRLEMNGILKSWAVPKEPPKTKGVKRLAIQVEDHPLSYAKFEGEIKEGYGKGSVKIWDEGTYTLDENMPKKLVMNLKGKKLNGNYVLIKTNYGSKPEKSWLFFKV